MEVAGNRVPHLNLRRDENTWELLPRQHLATREVEKMQAKKIRTEQCLITGGEGGIRTHGGR